MTTIMMAAVMLSAGSLWAQDATEAKAEHAATPWVGVRLQPVGAALAAQMKLDGSGLVVENIATGSPAEKAGVERYDVIVKIGNEPVSSDAAQFAAHVAKLEAGQRVRLTLLRDGKRRRVNVVLAQRPCEPVAYAYQPEEDVAWTDHYRVGQQLVRAEPGSVVTINGREIRIPRVLASLPDNFVATTEVEVKGDAAVARIRRKENGKSLTVERRSDGVMVVTRADSRAEGDDQERVAEFDTVEALQAGDTEAYELFQSVGEPRKMLHLTVPSIAPEVMAKVRRKVADTREDIAELSDQAGREIGDLLERMDVEAERIGSEWMAELRELVDSVRQSPEGSAREFEIDENGRITVHLRSDEGDMTLRFKDENDLREKAPALHEAYKALLSGGN
ncbi:MAG: S1C family serine protease, partial [Planctomycetota bacterium]|jgi:hypothetical protein